MSRLGRGITPKQAKYLAALLREAGERWNHNGISAREASLEIARLKELLAADPTPRLTSRSPESSPEPESIPSPNVEQARSDAGVKRALARATPVGG